MFGFQEILIISAIILGALVIPRMMTQTKRPQHIVQTRKRLSGKRRLAIAVSIVFPLITAAVLKPWQKDPIAYFYFGIGPVLLGWLLFWVLRGFRRP